ncbi:hypothetical protein LIER_25937 [Lithospermum erythrorhizon]|uniref:Uncharacterized protein n=1 Tax=Lithospermum erythrorhizon TaxID=34254 RepID=A0AAV3R850_LITER
MNRIIFKGVKKNILHSGKGGGSWIEELPMVLWSLRSTPNQATGEAPFSLVYGTEAILPAEVGLPTYRTIGFEEESNDQRLKEYLNFLDELMDEALYKTVKYKQLMASQPREQSKFSPKWEGPYRVKRVVGPNTYELEGLDGKAVPGTWHASKLCKYYE